MIPVFIKFDSKTPQKMNMYSFGMLLGRNRYFEMTVIMIPRITLVTEDTTEAATCRILVIRTVLEIDEQNRFTLGSV